jgi:hypothetical protein
MIREGILQITVTNGSIPFTKKIPRLYNHRYCGHGYKCVLEYFTLNI